jgi:N-acetylneuraminic acid mutarotase
MNSKRRIPRHAFVLILALSIYITTFLSGTVSLAQDNWSWSFAGSLSTPRSGHTATLLADGKVLVVGGGHGNFYAELYDPATGTWSATGSLNISRSSHTATLLPNGRVLVAGGITNSLPPDFGVTSSAELYDPATGTWSLTGGLNVARFWHTATPLANGKVLVAAGGGGNGNNLDSAEVYDPQTGMWSFTGNLAVSRYGQTATLLQNGQVLIVGGSNGGEFDTTLHSAELYDPATGAWSLTGSLNESRVLHTASLLPTGKVLVAAGLTATWVPTWIPGGGSGYLQAAVYSLDGAELYDPATGSWSPTGHVNGPGHSHAATVLPNGMVLITGGDAYGYWDYGAPLSLRDAACSATYSCFFFTSNGAELYDPVTGTWQVAASLNMPRSGHTATLLHNRNVLVAAGADHAVGVLNSAELYDLHLLKFFGLTANLASPANLGDSIIFTATATDDVGSLEYKWWLFDGLAWSVVKDWSTGNTFSWTPTLGGNYRIGVWVKSSGNADDAPENNAFAGIDFTIYPWPRLVITGVTADQTSAQPAGATINFTATISGGQAPIQYKWWVFNGTMWLVVEDWSTSNTFSWTPGFGDNYRVGVWARSSPNLADAPESSAFAGVDFTINAPPNLVILGLSADQVSPQSAGSMITFTATTSGGLAPLQYKWWLFNGIAWSVVKDWSTSSSFNWTAGLGGNYHVGVWVKSSLNPADAPENSAFASVPFTITAPPGLMLTELTADQASPQPAGSTINFTAMTAGGLAPLQYKWWVFNGVGWSVGKNWSGSNSFAWTAGLGGNYHVGVWVKSNLNPADAPENNAFTSVAFTINAPASLLITGLMADQVSPQPAGSTITFTAATSGGLAPLQYKWWLFNGVVWTVVKDWSTSSSFAWTAGFRGNYRIGVWVKSNLNPTDAPENSAFAGVDFTIDPDPACQGCWDYIEK